MSSRVSHVQYVVTDLATGFTDLYNYSRFHRFGDRVKAKQPIKNGAVSDSLSSTRIGIIG